ncbi:MAG: hypothetical protein Q8P40_02920 [Nitrospirota bacterium]|nr:hypothetical protein [Nitrospirota bacterium]
MTLVYNTYSPDAAPRLRHRAPVSVDGEGVELDEFAAVGAGDFCAKGGGGDLRPGAAEGAGEGW